jgi:hypothetical protein
MDSYELETPQHLTSLSNGSLFDLLADAPEPRSPILRPLLRQRGFTAEEIADEIRARQAGERRPTTALMRSARKLVAAFSLTVACFNLLSLLQFVSGDGVHKIPITLFSLSLVAFGFYLGLKLNTFLYLENNQRLACGFPCAVGHIDVDSGAESLAKTFSCYLRMLGNTLISINFVLFPALLCNYLLN